jgi:hypothetical protein
LRYKTDQEHGLQRSATMMVPQLWANTTMSVCPRKRVGSWINVNPHKRDYKPGTKLFELNESFNIRYTTMLLQLQEAFSGTPKTLYTAIMDSMNGLTPIAHEMMKIAVDEVSGSPTGCPTFDWAQRELQLV